MQGLSLQSIKFLNLLFIHDALKLILHSPLSPQVLALNLHISVYKSKANSLFYFKTVVFILQSNLNSLSLPYFHYHHLATIHSSERCGLP